MKFSKRIVVRNAIFFLFVLYKILRLSSMKKDLYYQSTHMMRYTKGKENWTVGYCFPKRVHKPEETFSVFLFS